MPMDRQESIPMMVHSISYELLTKHDSRKTQLSMFINIIKFLGSHAVVLVKTFPFVYHLLV